MILKTVTLQEANNLLPMVREHFVRIHILLLKLQRLRDKFSAKKNQFILNKESVYIILKKNTNKRKKSILKKVKNLELIIENELSELMRFGAVIKSLFPTHIDFLSIKNNEHIYLCWHGGEQEICHWHLLDDHAQCRQTIKQKNNFGPHVVH